MKGKIKERVFLGIIGLLMVGILIYGRRILYTGPVAPVGLYLVGMIVIIACALIMCRDERVNE